jgi:alkanesulfonate monooxygenase SsuD/methylene tetrahydromethanopterin reductase-like flavin-dependent oxidoreductase (luciferase family)
MLPTAARTGDGRVLPRRAVDAARVAESAGLDTVYAGDHVLHPRPLLESVVTLSVVAGATERVGIGTCVMLMALRDPLLLARQLWTLAAFAPGRLRVGVGVGGEYPAEFEACDVPLGERGRRMEQALDQVRAMLAAGGLGAGAIGGGPAAGDAGSPVPFLLAGRSEPALRRAATCSDGWIGYLLSVDGFARRRAFLTDCRAGSDRAGEPFTTGMLIPVLVTPEGPAGPARAAAEWAKLTLPDTPFPERLFVAGTAEEVAEALHAYWAAGCTELVLAPADQGDGYPAQVDALAGSVLPLVRSFA